MSTMRRSLDSTIHWKMNGCCRARAAARAKHTKKGGFTPQGAISAGPDQARHAVVERRARAVARAEYTKTSDVTPREATSAAPTKRAPRRTVLRSHRRAGSRGGADGRVWQDEPQYTQSRWTMIHTDRSRAVVAGNGLVGAGCVHTPSASPSINQVGRMCVRAHLRDESRPRMAS
jgi:hypothetical protein